MDNFEKIEGEIDNIVFLSPHGDYAVFSVAVEGVAGGASVTATAQVAVAVGQKVQIYGEFVNHPVYGRQFKASIVEQMLPQSASGMEKYLAKNIKGIGEKTAAAILEKFGLAVFEVLETAPEEFAKIKGITREKALQMGEEFREKSAQRNTMMYLQSIGLTTGQCDKIWKKYAHEAISKIKQNPYILIQDIYGIGFKIADAVAHQAGMDARDPNRIAAGVRHTLQEGLSEGHVYLPRAMLLARSVQLLGLSEDEVANQLIQMQLDKAVKQEKIGDETAIYLSEFYHSEVSVARKLLELNQSKTFKNFDAMSEIDKIEKEDGISLANMQKVAVKEALEQGVVVITGGPGTGKTTTVKTIIRILEKLELEVILCAPTGRAAKRMSEATGMPASTIHRLIGIFRDEEPRSFVNSIDEDMKLKGDCIIVDETSMVDIMILFRLLEYVKQGARLVLVGDVNQLPSVGPGNVLKDIISSGEVKAVYLDEIFRQGQESAIVMNAHKINKGEYPVTNDNSNDFFFIREGSAAKLADVVASLASRRLPNFLNVNSIRDIQVLCPQRKTLCGVENLNKILQEVLNPPSSKKREKQMGFFAFREGDKVMQIKNNYNTEWNVLDKKGEVAENGLGVFNGDEGFIRLIDNEKRVVEVIFYDDKIVHYKFEQLDELILAYAITIHKSQGSEYDVVILPIHSGNPLLFSRNLLYTAITRAKRLVVVVGVEATMRRMVDNTREDVRYSALGERIKKFYEKFHENND